MKNLGDKIKQARKEAGLSQVKLARLIGTSQQSIIAWEKGVRKPLPIFIKQLEQTLNISLKEEQDEKNKKDPSPD